MCVVARRGYMVGRMPTAALIVTDMLNRYEHEDAEPLMDSVRAIVEPLRSLVADAAQESEILTVYANDNHGQWAIGRQDLVEWARGGRDPSLVEPIVPPDHAPFIIKARHSAFYGTQLNYLLWQSGVKRLIIAGQVTEQCIMYTALDAYLRHYEVVLPSDAMAHIFEDFADAAVRMMERNMHAQVVKAADAIEAACRGGVS
jgi:nicotinamidase-related amidase